MVQGNQWSNSELRSILGTFGIRSPDHPALKDRGSLGRFLVCLRPPEGHDKQAELLQWRECRRALSHAGIDQLREALKEEPPPANLAAGGALSPESETMEELGEEEGILHDHSLSEIRERAPDQFRKVIEEMEGLVTQKRFLEAFRLGCQQFDIECDESLVDACVYVGHEASLWDRKERIAPYFLQDPFEELATAFGKHVFEMRHIDPDPLRATSGLYCLATKIYFAWVDHCAAVLEHQHRRTNTSWIQLEWIPPHRFNCLLSIMRSAVRIKLPLDLLQRVYRRIRAVIRIGKEAIALDGRKIKFEGDCLRILASPTKDVIPDLCYQIYRDIIDTYVEAGETASAIMFCDQALLIRRGDRAVEHIKAEIITQSGRKRPSPSPWGTHQHGVDYR